MNKEKENNSPFCPRNLKLDCPADCQLNKYANDLIARIVELSGLSISEVKAQFRSEDIIEIMLMDLGNNMALRDVGMENLCDFSDQAAEPKFGWDQ